jgi:hypothetical protein
MRYRSWLLVSVMGAFLFAHHHVIAALERLAQLGWGALPIVAAVVYLAVRGERFLRDLHDGNSRQRR